MADLPYDGTGLEVDADRPMIGTDDGDVSGAPPLTAGNLAGATVDAALGYVRDGLWDRREVVVLERAGKGRSTLLGPLTGG